MKTPIVARDLRKEPPHSPRARLGGFAILARTVDKCRAAIAGNLGEYHYDCPLDNQLFRYEGINGEQFKKAVLGAKDYEDVAAWLQIAGLRKNPAEIEEWSNKMESVRLLDMSDMKDEEKREAFLESCRSLGLDPETTTLFDWLEADDRSTFSPHVQPVAK